MISTEPLFVIKYLPHSALCSLHELGWVHRDISSGNILIFDGGVKLADLEYAKHDGDFSVHGIRTVCDVRSY